MATALVSPPPHQLERMDKETHVVLPGEDVTDQIAHFTSDQGAKFVVGPGLIRKEKRVFATAAGHLMRRKDPLVFWIHANQRRVGNLPVTYFASTFTNTINSTFQ